MAVEVTLGKVGVTPQGDWSASYNSGNGYAKLDEVKHDHDTWTSKVDGNKAEPGTDATKWFRNTDSGSAAYEAAQTALSAAATATEQAEAAHAAVVAAELAAVAVESDVRAIVTGYTYPTA